MAVCLTVLVFSTLHGAVPGRADTTLYTVTGVEVDARDTDAAKAKLKAISQAQVKAFEELLQRVGGPDAIVKARKFTPSQIGRMMSSLSVEQERTGPGRYIGKLTIKFLPKRVRAALSKAGITYVEEQSPSITIVPVWRTADGALELWQDNPWRTAWLDLKAENALVPLSIPLGDVTDTEALTVEDLAGDPSRKLESLSIRYGTQAALIALAEPAGDNAIKAVMRGDSPIGAIDFDKTYVADEGGIEAAARQAASRFHTVMIFKWTKSQTTTNQSEGSLQTVNIAVPFSTLQEWNHLRSQMSRTPGVQGVNVSSLSSNSAIVRVTYAQGFEALRAAMAQNGLNMVLVGGTWVVQPL